MDKKDKVKEIKNLQKKDSYGNNSFILKMENGDEGFYRCKAELPAFKVGDEIEYVFETKTKKDGTGTYNNISLPKKDFEPKKAGGGYTRQPRTKQDVRSEVPFKAADKIVDLVISGKIVWEKFQTYHKELCTYLYDEIETAFSESGEGKS